MGVEALIRPRIASASSGVAFWFSRPNESVAARLKWRLSRPVAANRSKPRSLRTSPEYTTPGRRSIAATTSSAPAICGTRPGWTKLTASIAGRPAAASRLTRSARTAGSSTACSFWSPSRGPTSQTVTLTPA